WGLSDGCVAACLRHGSKYVTWIRLWLVGVTSVHSRWCRHDAPESGAACRGLNQLGWRTHYFALSLKHLSHSTSQYCALLFVVFAQIVRCRTTWWRCLAVFACRFRGVLQHKTA